MAFSLLTLLTLIKEISGRVGIKFVFKVARCRNEERVL